MKSKSNFFLGTDYNTSIFHEFQIREMRKETKLNPKPPIDRCLPDIFQGHGLHLLAILDFTGISSAWLMYTEAYVSSRDSRRHIQVVIPSDLCKRVYLPAQFQVFENTRTFFEDSLFSERPVHAVGCQRTARMFVLGPGYHVSSKELLFFLLPIARPFSQSSLFSMHVFLLSLVSFHAPGASLDLMQAPW